MVSSENTTQPLYWSAPAAGFPLFVSCFYLAGKFGTLHVSVFILNNSEILFMFLTPILIFYILSSKPNRAYWGLLLSGPSMLLFCSLGLGLVLAYFLHFFRWTRNIGKVIFGILSIPASLGLLIVPFGSILGGEALMKSEKFGDKYITQYICGRGHSTSCTLYIETPIWSVFSFRKNISLIDESGSEIEVIDSKHFKYFRDGREYIEEI